MDNNNPADPNAGVPPVVDPNAGQPASDAPMGGSVYTPPAEPSTLGDQPTSEAPVETPVETPAPMGGNTTGGGEQNPGGETPVGGAPVV